MQESYSIADFPTECLWYITAKEMFHLAFLIFGCALLHPFRSVQLNLIWVVFAFTAWASAGILYYIFRNRFERRQARRSTLPSM